MAANWNAVFSFARKLTFVAAVFWVRELKSLSAETQNSREIIMDPQKATKILEVESAIAANKNTTKILSAIGSNISPKSLVREYLRARNPSKKSVKLHNKNRAKDNPKYSK